MFFLFHFFIFVLVVCDATNDTTNNAKPKMLQIGIKKRVENCIAKSKKGDMLHLHYNVSGFKK